MRRSVVAGLGVLLALSLLAGPAPAAKSRGKTHKVAAEGSWPFMFRWEPSSIEIAAGDKVIWTNATSSEHHITPYDGPWGDVHLHLESGGRAAFVFKKPGVYKYYCDLQYHGQLLPGDICFGQCGEITVN